MMSANRAWATIGVAVLAYDLACDDGCTLSEQVDAWLTTHPVTTRAAIVVLAAHLANALPPRVDIIHLGFVALRRIRR